MTPDEAIQFLDAVASAARLTREDHILAQKAIVMLGEMIERSKETKPAPKKRAPRAEKKA